MAHVMRTATPHCQDFGVRFDVRAEVAEDTRILLAALMALLREVSGHGAAY